MSEKTIVYDDFGASGDYGLEEYSKKWLTPFGLGEMEIEDTRSFDGGVFSIDATPFKTGSDYQFYDHIKYYSQTAESWTMPKEGKLGISCAIEADTTGTVEGKMIEGVNTSTGSAVQQQVLEGQQAAALLCLTNIAETGQLFDWFVSRNKAFCLVERLPGETAGIDKIYTQIVSEHDIEPGFHEYSIEVQRTGGKLSVEFLIDGEAKERVGNIGIPLDKAGSVFSGTYPSVGDGEPLDEAINEFGVALGLFSLLDVFPFQHEEAPELSVSVPLENRLFGQGAKAHFKKLVITSDGE